MDVNRAPCCGTPQQLSTGGKNEIMSERRKNLLMFLKGGAKDKKQLKKSNPDLYKYFERVWMVRENHMNTDLPGTYLMLNQLLPTRMPPSFEWQRGSQKRSEMV